MQALAPPPQGEQIALGPFPVAPGGEVQLCRTRKRSNTDTVGLNRARAALNQRSNLSESGQVPLTCIQGAGTC